MLWTQYRVRKGDVLGKISAKYNVSVAAIKQSNKLRNNLIHPGDILLIPSLGSKPTSINKKKKKAKNTKVATTKSNRDNGGVKHRIRSGDTLWEIAKRYGVKVADISRWNSIRPSQTLKLGEVLLIYRKS